MNQFKRSIARSSFVLFVATVLSGLLMQVASAAIVAEFTTTWSANSSAEAEATGVSYAGADARGKVFLEEERTNSPHDVLRKLQPPSEADVAKYATSVSSMDQAQAVLTKEVATYDKVVAKAKKKVLKLKLKLKHGESSDKAKLKKKLKKAKKVQNLVKTSWKYKPLLKFERGMSYRNTGRNDRLILESFVDYVDGDKAFVVAGWVPELRDIVIVAVKKTDGTYLAGCNNFVYFNIPPGTLDRSVVVIVRVLAEVELEVSVGVRVAGRLTAHGVMKNNGVVCDEDSTFTDVNEFKALPPVKVRATDAAKAFDIGRNQAQADAKARAEVKNKLKIGSLSLAEALASTEDTIGKLKVVSLLESLPGVGKVKARKIMDEIGIADNRRVQGLGQQQKASLLDQLGK